MKKSDSASYVLNNLEVHKQLQESILRDIGRRLVKNPELITDTAAWQAEKLQQSGMLFDDITKELSKVTKRQQKEIKAAFDEAETQIFGRYEDEEITAAGFEPIEFKKLSSSMQQAWTATLAKTSTEAINLTKTTALTSQSAYIEACDLALMQVQSGTFDYNTAIKNACMQAGTKGVNVVYPSGWVDKLDVAIRRSVFTGVSQTAGEIQDMRATELDIDIMELTAHSGARPEHAKWQGMLVSRSGRKGYLSLADIDYGTTTGFKGINCSHDWFLFFEGISKRKYTDEELEALRNETVTYNGEEIPKWQAIEKQRAIERAVKESKRQLVVLDEGLKNAKTDDLKAELQTAFNNTSVRLKKQEARLKDLCKQTGLYYDNSRVQVFTQATENGIKNWGKSVSGKAVWANKKSIDNSTKSAIINTKKNTEVHDVHYIGKIDKDIYKCVSKDIITDEVIITEERINHIKERHPRDYERYCGYLKDIVAHPDYIIETNKPNTALILKSFSENEEQFKTVLRLITPIDNKNFKNSVITFMKINEKEWKRLVKNKNILYKAE